MTAAEGRILDKLGEIQSTLGGFVQGQATQDKQIGELFRKHALLERNGCGKAGMHEDHEGRLRAVEHGEVGRQPKEPQLGVSLGRWFRVSGYRMQDVVLLLFALMVLGMVWFSFQGRAQLQELSQNMDKIMMQGREGAHP